MSRRNPNKGLFHGFWFDMAGKKIRRLRRNEYPMAYHLYGVGTEMGLTVAGASRVDRSVHGDSLLERHLYLSSTEGGG